MPNTPKHNHKYLENFRKENRNNATSAEAKLWSLLKGKHSTSKVENSEDNIVLIII